MLVSEHWTEKSLYEFSARRATFPQQSSLPPMVLPERASEVDCQKKSRGACLVRHFRPYGVDYLPAGHVSAPQFLSQNSTGCQTRNPGLGGLVLVRPCSATGAPAGLAATPSACACAAATITVMRGNPASRTMRAGPIIAPGAGVGMTARHSPASWAGSAWAG